MKNRILLLCLLLFVCGCSDNKNDNSDEVNGIKSPVVLTPDVLEMTSGDSATFTSSEPSYISAIIMRGDMIEDATGEWNADDYVTVWSTSQVPAEENVVHSLSWCEVIQQDACSYSVEVGDIAQPYEVLLMVSSRVESREPAQIRITAVEK